MKEIIRIRLNVRKQIEYSIFSLLLNLYYQELYASTLFRVLFYLIEKYFYQSRIIY